MANKVGVKHAIAVSNGTAALDVVFQSIDIKPGDEVVMPAFTIISCALQVVRMGGIPVLVDSDPLDWNMQTGQTVDALTPRTRAVLAVHTYGLTVDLDPITSACEEREIVLIEDAAEAHGLDYKDRSCGSIWDVGTFSFYSNKTVTCGEGGMVTTNSDDLADRVRLLRNLAFNSERRFVHEHMGWNMRMGSLQAALGLSQLERLTNSIARKREIGERYRQTLEDIPDIFLAPHKTENSVNSYWVVGLILGESHPDSVEVRNRLAAAGVGSRPFFCPMHLQPVFRDMGLFEQDQHPVAERLWFRGLYLPSGLGLSNADIDLTCDTLRKVLV